MDPVKTSEETFFNEGIDSSQLPNSEPNHRINGGTEAGKAFIAISLTIEEDKKKPPVKAAKTGWRKYCGTLLTIAAALQFSLSALIIKVLGYNPLNLGVWRFFIMTLIPIPFLWHAIFWKKQKIFQNLCPPNSTLVCLLVQAAVGANALLLIFFALQYLTVADTLVIATSAPIFVTLLAFFCLRERSGFFPFLMAFVSLIGVGIISKPPIITGAASYDKNLMIGTLISLGSMLGLATGYVIVRYLRTINHWLVNFSFSLFGFLECAIAAYFYEVLSPPKTLTEIGLIIATAFLAFFAQTCITLALKYEEAGPVSLIRTTEILFAFLWQLVFLGVIPDVFSILGAVLVITAVILSALRKMLHGLPEHHRYKRRFRVLLF